jgi:phospholipase C
MNARKIPILFLLIIPTATFTVAQTQQGPFSHIIIIVQENRTPDNLFGANPAIKNCSQENPFESGVDIADGGYGYVPQQHGPPQGPQFICNTSLPLNGWDAKVPRTYNPIDPDRTYEGWQKDYRGYNGTITTNNPMTGFCWEYNNYPIYGSTCPSYSYVQKSDVQPYFDIATAYGFANYMFQSNQGPSLEAHQFLFTGTSAPVAPGDPDNYNWDFAADLVNRQPLPSGCAYTNSGVADWPRWVQPNGVLENDRRTSECYAHDSLVTDANDCKNQNDGTDYCDRGIDGLPSVMAWGYYVEPGSAGGTSVWDAPAYIPEVCYGENSNTPQGTSCGDVYNGNSTEWSDHIRIPRRTIPYARNQKYSWAPILDDILACKLPAVSWVIPDMSYSDHAYAKSASNVALGPSWVGDIVDTVGQSYRLTGKKCDYWGYGTGSTNSQPTAIFVVWDDWGGWYDHVQPPTDLVRIDQIPLPPGYSSCDPTQGQWGCGYTDGLRVPLLVVSPYTPNYVSGACGSGEPNQCPHFGPPSDQYQYVHDFGSILAYIEWNFGFNPPFIAAPYYADYNAPEWGPQHNNVPLSDFFPLPVGQGLPFTYIKTPNDYTCFQNHIKSKTCALDSSWVAGPPDSD